MFFIMKIFIYIGLSPVKNEEVLELYGSRKIDAAYIEPPNQYGNTNVEYVINLISDHLIEIAFDFSTIFFICLDA